MAGVGLTGETAGRPQAAVSAIAATAARHENQCMVVPFCTDAI